MTRARYRTTALIILTTFWVASGCWPARVSAQTPAGARGQAARPATGPAAPASVVVSEQNADETLQQLEALLSRYPPALGRVLKLDPTLLGNPAYLAPYPALAEFLARHPEVGHNPAYFLGFVRGAGEWQPPEVRSEAAMLWQNMMEALGVGAVFFTVMGTFAWLVRLLVDYRRWSRLAKVQTDAHNKLLDRFTANDELLAYIRTPAGSRFLESAPIALDPGHRAISAPFGRILWSIQAGVVLAAGGLGLQFVSMRVEDKVSEPIFALGVLGLALGAGFVISAVVAYALSRRLGLFEPAAAVVGSERRDSNGA